MNLTYDTNEMVKFIPEINKIQIRTKQKRDNSNAKIKEKMKYKMIPNIEEKLKSSKMKHNLLKSTYLQRKKESQKMKTEFIDFERSHNISNCEKTSVLLEKDFLKKEITELTGQLVDKSENLERLEIKYRSLAKENDNLVNKINELQEKEDTYEEVS